MHVGVEFTLLDPASASPGSPLVVALHGEGGSPERWVSGFARFPGEATIALPRGFEPHESGFRWFPWNADLADPKLAADVAAAEERLWAGIADLAGRRRVLVTGFSGGGVLSFAMVVKRTGVVAGAFPVSAACPPSLLPKAPAAVAPVIAYHGDADAVIPVARARETIRALSALGGDARLREYARAGHGPSDAAHDDHAADMLAAIRSIRST
jgi:phospholipase/carboxylesterase